MKSKSESVNTGKANSKNSAIGMASEAYEKAAEGEVEVICKDGENWLEMGWDKSWQTVEAKWIGIL